ncbi:PREDICTED: uncharacterized protein LOC109233934 isoform X1 [Nicotiana attenuata]|uniref:uncharacterized protein LOC109233934 isoform X1 n=2 Tax=Nicotiana attenuata TaxID=49451 RepID=UPI0009046DB2|nr:PREDICTED: uncharacterized protein LOC109233934 isoform X1 [Nicotiana attenuata]
MKLVWSPETASKAYLDTIKTCGISRKSSAAEFLSAMGAGYNAKLIVEAWKSDKINGDSISTSIGLAVASKHSRGRYVCMVPDEESRLAYVDAMQNSGMSLPDMMVGEAEEVMERLNGVDFLIVDEKRSDSFSIFNSAKLSHRGAILVCKNGSKIRNIETSKFSWDGVLDSKVSVVRSVTLPFGNGLEVAYIASKDGNQKSRKYAKRWIRHVDRKSGEEHVIRR